MILPEILSIAMFAAVCVVLMLGYPVAFSLAGTGLGFALIGMILGVFDTRILGGLASRFFGVMLNEVLVAVPLFVFMGVMLERSRIAEDLLTTMGGLFGKLRGGLGLSVVLVGTLLAASTGIVGATVVTMGLLCLPTMLRAGYDPRLATGVICASGTLGQIIPPSIVLVVLGDILQGANTQAQLALGNYAPDPISVIDLFAGALLPGLGLVVLYCLWLVVMALWKPESCPPVPSEFTGVALRRRVVTVLIPPVILILSVLGSILAGVATPTEAAALGAMGATLLAMRQHTATNTPSLLALGAIVVLLVLSNVADLRMQRDDIPLSDLIAAIFSVGASLVLVGVLAFALIRLKKGQVLVPVTRSTLEITCMVFVILLGASIFSLVFRGFGGDQLIEEVLISIPGGKITAMIAVMLVIFLLGFFLDFLEIVFVVVPIIGPVLLKLGFDPIWLGIMLGINLQTSFLTPPFGFALFYLRGVAPASVTTMQIYRGIVPFVAIQIVMLAILSLWPELAVWLPSILF